MLPNALSPSKSNNHDNKTPQESGSSRRYSLFGTSTTIGGSPLVNLFGSSQSCKSDSSGSVGQTKKQVVRRNTYDTMTGTVCQRCKRFEIDLTNTSDNLSATDAELKASRQVISLLQRQLELFRVEKEGLEKLIISQSNKPPQVDVNSFYVGSTSNDDKILEGFTEIGSSSAGQNSSDKQKMLLNLIQTQLYAKDEEIVKLKFSLKEAQNDKEQLNLQVHSLEEDNARLKNENSVLNENLVLRDQTIVSLSNEVFEQGNSHEFNLTTSRRQSNGNSTSDHLPTPKEQRQIAKLIDTLDAYKKTNELLSNNVTKLTERCGQAEKKEIETRSQCHELEAKCCQIQSKLLSLLKEIEQSSKQSNCGDKGDSQEVINSDSVRLLIQRLLEDKSLNIPLSWKEGNKSSRNYKEGNKNLNLKYECDELGFYIVTEPGEREKADSTADSSQKGSVLTKKLSYKDNSTLPTVEEAPESGEQDNERGDTKVRRGINLRQISVDATKCDEPRWHIRWDNFIKDFDNIDLCKSKDFKNLLRSGIPQEYRCKVWKALIELRIGGERKKYGQEYYQSLLQPNRPQNSSKRSLNPSSKQIELDLLRTLPSNKHFETLDSSGTVRLRRVLTAYSEHNPKVGYCQGMNRLAAVALLVLPEEEAFWCLTTIVDNIMPLGYYNDLWLAQVDSSVVMDFVAIKLPDLNDHFRRYSIELSLFAWFLTIFVDGTPPALFLRLWDAFLFEGDKILFRVALALLWMHEKELLNLSNSVAVNNFLRSAVNAPMEIDRFFEIAFELINPLSTRSLRIKRQHNFQLMKSGFDLNYGSQVSPPLSESVDEQERRNSKNDDSPFEDSSIISI